MDTSSTSCAFLRRFRWGVKVGGGEEGEEEKESNRAVLYNAALVSCRDVEVVFMRGLL